MITSKQGLFRTTSPTPLHLSANKGSPHYNPLARHAIILFNGLRIKYIVEADEAAGVILRYPTNARGVPGGTPVLEQGVVKIVFPFRFSSV